MVYKYCFFCFDIQNNICTQHVVNLYFLGNSMNNLSSYCGLTDVRMRASEKSYLYHLPQLKKVNDKNMDTDGRWIFVLISKLTYMCYTLHTCLISPWVYGCIWIFTVNIKRLSSWFQVSAPKTVGSIRNDGMVAFWQDCHI